MNTTTLPQQASDLATQVGDTMTDVLSKGRERARDIVTAAEERLPEHAVDWTREHVPGITPPRRRNRARGAAAMVALIAAAVAVVWWLQRRRADDMTTHLADDGVSATPGLRRAGRAA